MPDLESRTLKKHTINENEVYLLTISFTQGVLSSILKIKNFNLTSEAYLYQEGRPAFKSFARDARKFYADLTFQAILEAEKHNHPSDWQNITDHEEKILFKIATDLDNKPELLN